MPAMRIKHELLRQMRLASGATQQEVADQIEAGYFTKLMMQTHPRVLSRKVPTMRCQRGTAQRW
jgi:hypothetical protein